MPGVGAIGFLLGGGLSNLSSRFGFGADVVSVWEVSKLSLICPLMEHLLISV